MRKPSGMAPSPRSKPGMPSLRPRPAWPRSLLLIAATLLAGCATATSDPTVLCPALTAYTPAQQIAAAAEIEALPAGSQIGSMVVDYGDLRRRIRAACPPAP